MASKMVPKWQWLHEPWQKDSWKKELVLNYSLQGIVACIHRVRLGRLESLDICATLCSAEGVLYNF